MRYKKKFKVVEDEIREIHRLYFEETGARIIAQYIKDNLLNTKPDTYMPYYIKYEELHEERFKERDNAVHNYLHDKLGNINILAYGIDFDNFKMECDYEETEC